jgi:hypothetical protein
VVISGNSAGGLAVFIHVDTWALKIKAAAKVPPSLVGGVSDD